MTNNQYFLLLKDWCDRMVRLQITEKTEPEFYGGILCPACSMLHGRSENAIYPLLTAADKTGDSRYVEAAKRLFDWTEHNMLREDGSFFNDRNSSWNSITIFSAQGLAEALIHHGDLLDDKTKDKWQKRLERQAEYAYNYMDSPSNKPVVNYYTGLASALALCGKALDEAKYTQKAKEHAKTLTQYFSEDNLIFGEGKPIDGLSPKGCRPVDIGYNVEESLPALVTYALCVGDDEMLKISIKLLNTHLEFMLPDGGWDNSFGLRMAKWSYWGSRTSDGCQIALCKLGEENPVFAEAAHRNFMLYKRCTQDGLLYGGPMYHAAGQPPCVHHTFCHAKAVAHMVDSEFRYITPEMLPREQEKGVLYFPSVDVSLISKGDWRATVSGYDFAAPNMDLYSSGGAITMLWHKKANALFAASMPQYGLVEPNNMQHPRFYDSLCQTPRFEYYKDNVRYTSIYDREASVVCNDKDAVKAVVSGKLKSNKGGFQYGFSAEYVFDEDFITLELLTDAPKASFYFPIISPKRETVRLFEKGAVISGENHEVSVDCDGELKVQNISAKRNFNAVGGFQTIPFYTPLTKDKKTVIKIMVK